ncbi:MAG: class D sortase [Lactobacillales bacterium]|nr:class D sortase [Lactobacillales bacterium]
MLTVILYAGVAIAVKPYANIISAGINLFTLDKKPDYDQSKSVYTDSVDNDKQVILSSTIKYPKEGEQYGEVIYSKLELDQPLYFGDTPAILAKGAAQYMGSVFPGMGGTTLIGGHKLPYFGKLYFAEVGDTFEINTNYATYTYQVKEKSIKQFDDPMIDAALKDMETNQVILYTCYPMNSVGATKQRVFVVAEQIHGPKIDLTK